MRDPTRRHRPRGQPLGVTLCHRLPPLSDAACRVRGPAYRATVTERTSEISLPPEPPWGIEPQTYALREARYTVLGVLPALTAAHASLNALNAQSSSDSRSKTRSTARQPFSNG